MGYRTGNAGFAFGRSLKGAIQIDDGARDALLSKGRSLLSAGVVAVEGEFEIGEAVAIKDVSGNVLAAA